VYWRRAERSRVCVLAGPFSVLTALTGVVTRPVSLPLKPSRGLLATVCRMALPLVRLGLSATAGGAARTPRAADAARFNQPKPKPNPPAEPSPVDGFSFAFWRGLSPPCADRPSRCLYVRLRTFAYVCGVRCQPLTRRCVRGARCLGLPVRRCLAPGRRRPLPPRCVAVFRLESFSGFVGFWNFFTISKIPLSISVLES
jgi:hypothetical protein